MSKATELIKEYFCAGGLYNPELMEHEKVRNMIALAQEELTAAQAEIARLREVLKMVDGLIDRVNSVNDNPIALASLRNMSKKLIKEALNKGEL